MTAADILMYGFLLLACCVVAWVSWAAGKAHAARMYAADLATARTAARHYRAERDSAQAHLDMLRRAHRHGQAPDFLSGAITHPTLGGDRGA